MIPRPAIFALIPAFARERELTYVTLAEMCDVTVATLDRWRKAHHAKADGTAAQIMVALLASERGSEITAVNAARRACGLPPYSPRLRRKPWAIRYANRKDLTE